MYEVAKLQLLLRLEDLGNCEHCVWGLRLIVRQQRYSLKSFICNNVLHIMPSYTLLTFSGDWSNGKRRSFSNNFYPATLTIACTVPSLKEATRIHMSGQNRVEVTHIPYVKAFSAWKTALTLPLQTFINPTIPPKLSRVAPLYINNHAISTVIETDSWTTLCWAVWISETLQARHN